MLNKSAELLALGLGEAGQKIFKSHLSNDFTKILETGRKVHCIFSFCNIADFQDILNTLESEILNFVNSASAILHHQVYNHLGFGNKNLGSTFLLVWKFHTDELTKITDEYIFKISDHKTKKRESMSLVSRFLPKIDTKKIEVQNKCDIALIGLVKAMIEIELCFDEPKFYSLRCRRNNFTMKFGMHCGWAVEGAIGSYMKMDTR
jgi:hypothetical protein